MPLATTTIRVERPTTGGDPYEIDAAPTVVSRGTAAHIGQPSGTEAQAGGELETITDVLLCEAGIDLQHTDLVVDEATDQRYRVQWVRARRGLGLDHVKAGLVTYQGAAVGG